MDILQLRGVLTLVLALGLITTATGICLLDVDQPIPTKFKHPLLVRELSAGLGELLHPELDPNGNLRFRIPENTNLRASCPGNNNVPNEDLTCKKGVLVYSQIPNPKVDWKGLECQSLPRANIKGPGNSCGNNGLTYKIGWDITPNLFVPLIEICFDANQETTQYTMHEIKGRSVGVKMVSSRYKFRHEDMFTVDVVEAYKQQNAKALFKKLLGTDEYLTVEGDHFLSKGHLTPDADFFYTAEQAATYFYGNAVPQWQCPNNCNWKRVESAIKRLAEDQSANFRVWTGTYGTLQFPKDKNNKVRIFLGLRENVEKIPIPAVMWKVIQNLGNKQAVAIVTVNEMRGQGSSSDIDFDISPCNNICNQLSWIDWDTLDEIRRGRTFCCRVSDLRKKITTLPNLGNVGLLNGSKKRPLGS